MAVACRSTLRKLSPAEGISIIRLPCSYLWPAQELPRMLETWTIGAVLLCNTPEQASRPGIAAACRMAELVEAAGLSLLKVLSRDSQISILPRPYS